MMPNDAAEICRRMGEVRASMGDEVEEIVDSAKTLSDWRYYLQRYPWACVAVAAVVGYAVVPKRVSIKRPSADALEELAKRHKLVIQTSEQPEAKSGLMGAALGMLGAAATRLAMNYAQQNAGTWIRQFQERRGGQDAKSHHEQTASY